MECGWRRPPTTRAPARYGRVAGFTEHDIVQLFANGWSNDLLWAIHEHAQKYGYEMEGVRSGGLIASFLQPTRLCRDDNNRRLIIHRDLTPVQALTAWADLPTSALVQAWTDGSGVTTDISVGAAAVLTSQPQLEAAEYEGLTWDHAPPHSYVWVRTRQKQMAVARSLGLGTNNTAETTAIQIALASCPRTDLRLHLYSDSAYAIGSLTQDWKAKKNVELIAEVRRHLALRPATFEHVRGHAGNAGNELADRIAGWARIK